MGEVVGESWRRSEEQDGAEGLRAAGAVPRGGGGTAGPLEISRNEVQPETLGAVLGKHLEWERWSRRSTHGQVWTPGSSTGVAEGSVTGMRSSKASHSTGSTSQTSQI